MGKLIMINPPDRIRSSKETSPKPSPASQPVRILLLDDQPTNLHLQTTILRSHGYECVPASTIEEATGLFNTIDIAVLDYNLGAGEFGTEVAEFLRRRRPHVPIIILSATLDSYFGGFEDMHLLKGHSSVEELLDALSSLAGSPRGGPAVVDARDFFYSRIALAIGDDVLVQIFDERGIWQHCSEAAARYLGHPHDWFTGRSIFDELSPHMRDWREVFRTVIHTRETWIDRSRRGLFQTPRPEEQSYTWSVLAFPITLHDQRSGIVLTARILEKNPPRRPELMIG